MISKNVYITYRFINILKDGTIGEILILVL